MNDGWVDILAVHCDSRSGRIWNFDFKPFLHRYESVTEDVSSHLRFGGGSPA